MGRSIGLYIDKNIFQLVILGRGVRGAKILRADSLQLFDEASISSIILSSEPKTKEAQKNLSPSLPYATNEYIEHERDIGASYDKKVMNQQQPAGTKTLASLQIAVMELLKRNKIKRGAVVTTALPPELIAVRYFQMPRLAVKEHKTAVSFEARKYIPYRIEDIVFDYIISYDKVPQGRMAVIFFAAEKTSVGAYLRFFSEVGLKINYLEAVPYSLTRLFYYVKAADVNQIVALVEIGKDSANINLMKNDTIYLTRNVPLVSRVNKPAIQLIEEPKTAQNKESDIMAKLDGLLADIRLSFDYFHRQFPEEKIEKLIAWSDYKNIQQWCGRLGNELNIAVEMSNPLIAMDGKKDVDIEYAPVCGLALRSMYGRHRDINLSPLHKIIELQRLVKMAIFEICLVLVSFLFIYNAGNKDAKIFQNELDKVIGQRPTLSGELNMPDFSAPALENTKLDIQKKIYDLRLLTESRIFITAKLNRLAKLMPDYFWLSELNYDIPKGKTKHTLTIYGYVYATKDVDRIAPINRFLESLKKDSIFSKDFAAIKIESIANKKYNNINAASFQIVCSVE